MRLGWRFPFFYHPRWGQPCDHVHCWESVIPLSEDEDEGTIWSKRMRPRRNKNDFYVAAEVFLFAYDRQRSLPWIGYG